MRLQSIKTLSWPVYKKHNVVCFSIEVRLNPEIVMIEEILSTRIQL